MSLPHCDVHTVNQAVFNAFTDIDAAAGMN